MKSYRLKKCTLLHCTVAGLQTQAKMVVVSDKETHMFITPLLFVMALALQPGVGQTAFLPPGACMCHCIHLSGLCSSSDFHMSDHSMWTPVPNLFDNINPNANNLFLNRFTNVTHQLRHVFY